MILAANLGDKYGVEVNVPVGTRDPITIEGYSWDVNACYNEAMTMLSEADQDGNPKPTQKPRHALEGRVEQLMSKFELCENQQRYWVFKCYESDFKAATGHVNIAMPADMFLSHIRASTEPIEPQDQLDFFKLYLGLFSDFDYDGSSMLGVKEYALLREYLYSIGVQFTNNNTVSVEETEETYQHVYLQTLGYLPEGAPLYSVFQSFEQKWMEMAGSKSALLSEDDFVVKAGPMFMESFHMSEQAVRAEFHKADKDGSGMLNFHEYVLLAHQANWHLNNAADRSMSNLAKAEMHRLGYLPQSGSRHKDLKLYLSDFQELVGSSPTMMKTTFVIWAKSVWKITEDQALSAFDQSEQAESGSIDFGNYVLLRHGLNEHFHMNEGALSEHYLEDELVSRGLLPEGSPRHTVYADALADFIKLAGSRDGTINEKVFAKSVVETFKDRVSYQNAIEYFNNYDLDKSGALNRDEFILLFDDIKQGRISQLANGLEVLDSSTLQDLEYLPIGAKNHYIFLEYSDVFQRLSGEPPGTDGMTNTTDSDDKRTLTEMKCIAHIMQEWGLSYEQARRLFWEYDADRSGKINLYEYVVLRHYLDKKFGAGSILALNRRRTEQDPPRVVIDGRSRSALGCDPGNLKDRWDVFKQRGIVSRTWNNLGKPGGHSGEAVGSTIDTYKLAKSRLQVECDWRGPYVDRSCKAYKCAELLEDNVLNLIKLTSQECATLDRHWQPDRRTCLAALFNGICHNNDQVAIGITALAQEAERIIKAQPVMVRVREPCKVIGSIHGQFHDLLLLFREFGRPTVCGDVECCTYVFNGGFAGSGQIPCTHQLEVVVLLLALKVRYPNRIYLLRGSTEFSCIEEQFQEFSLGTRLNTIFPTKGSDVTKSIYRVFSWLPFSALISDSVLVLHGGIGRGSWGVEELKAIQRPVKQIPSKNHVVRDVVLSMPTEKHLVSQQDADRNPIFDVHATEKFCAANDLRMLIRSGEYQPRTPMGYQLMHSGLLVHLFSARNFGMNREEVYQNDGAMALFAADGFGHIRLRIKRLLSNS